MVSPSPLTGLTQELLKEHHAMDGAIPTTVATPPPPEDDEAAIASAAPPALLAATGGIYFPLSFNIYMQFNHLKTIVFQLGHHKAQPLYDVVWRAKWSGKTTLTLHTASPSSSSAAASDVHPDRPVLASAESAGALTQNSVLMLPGGVREKLTSHTTLKSMSFSFVLAVPVSPGSVETYPEKFEWRQSHGAEVRNLHKGRRAWGWKLIRLSSRGTGASTPEKVNAKEGKEGKMVGERPLGESSDGLEVVAVWADYLNLSLSKLACFQFVGSGATGELGEEWTLMAVLSVLRLWQLVGARELQGY